MKELKGVFSWGINLTPLHISRKTNLISIQLYKTVKQLIQSRLKVKNADIIRYMLTSKSKKSMKIVNTKEFR